MEDAAPTAEEPRVRPLIEADPPPLEAMREPACAGVWNRPELLEPTKPAFQVATVEAFP